MHTSVIVIEDSVAPDSGKRLTTLLVRHPWVVHAEFLRHRILSPSVASSRAIPLNEQIESVTKEPYIPYKWGAKKKGMFATEVVPEEQQQRARDRWLYARDEAIKVALELEELGIHKENGAQLLKPFGYVSALWTGTEWENFFNLRTPVQAREEMRVLARRVRIAMEANKPVQRALHLPYIKHQEHTQVAARPGEISQKLKLGALPDQLPLHNKEMALHQDWIALSFASAARCARLSYNKLDGGKASLEEDVMKGAQHALDGHSSVLEHQGFVLRPEGVRPPPSNFKGPWNQFRKIFANEAVYRERA